MWVQRCWVGRGEEHHDGRVVSEKNQGAGTAGLVRQPEAAPLCPVPGVHPGVRGINPNVEQLGPSGRIICCEICLNLGSLHPGRCPGSSGKPICLSHRGFRRLPAYLAPAKASPSLCFFPTTTLPFPFFWGLKRSWVILWGQRACRLRTQPRWLAPKHSRTCR